MLEQTNLPKLSISVAEDYFFKLDRLSFDHAFLLFNFYVSKILCYNRVMIEVKANDYVPPNLYCLNFGSSGSGKDRSRKQMEKMIAFLYEDKERRERIFRKNKQFELEKEADGEGMGRAKKVMYIRDNMPRSLFSRIGSNATPEGLAAVHEVLNEAKFGEITWIDSEITDTMVKHQKGGATIDDLLTLIKEAADVGEFDSKVTKGNKSIRAQGLVPYLAWLHGAIDDKRGVEPFKSFLQLGFARRSIVHVAKRKQEKDERTIDEVLADEQAAISEKEFIIDSLKEIFNRTKDCAVYKLSDKAKRRYLKLKQDCQNKQAELPENALNSIKDDVGNRFFKSIKLACVFAAQNHKELLIKEQDLESAIETIDYFGGHLEGFLNIKTNNEKAIWELMLESLVINKVMKRTDFYKESYFPKFKSGQPKIFQENMTIAKEMIEEGKMIIETRPDKRTYAYEIIDRPDENEILNYIKVAGHINQLTMRHLVDKFGKGAEAVIEEHKIPMRSDGGYYIN